MLIGSTPSPSGHRTPGCSNRAHRHFSPCPGHGRYPPWPEARRWCWKVRSSAHGRGLRRGTRQRSNVRSEPSAMMTLSKSPESLLLERDCAKAGPSPGPIASFDLLHAVRHPSQHGLQLMLEIPVCRLPVNRVLSRHSPRPIISISRPTVASSPHCSLTRRAVAADNRLEQLGVVVPGSRPGLRVRPESSGGASSPVCRCSTNSGIAAMFVVHRHQSARHRLAHGHSLGIEACRSKEYPVGGVQFSYFTLAAGSPLD